MKRCSIIIFYLIGFIIFLFFNVKRWLFILKENKNEKQEMMFTSTFSSFFIKS